MKLLHTADSKKDSKHTQAGFHTGMNINYSRSVTPTKSEKCAGAPLIIKKGRLPFIRNVKSHVCANVAYFKSASVGIKEALGEEVRLPKLLSAASFLWDKQQRENRALLKAALPFCLSWDLGFYYPRKGIFLCWQP